MEFKNILTQTYSMKFIASYQNTLIFFQKVKIETNRIKERAPEEGPNPHNHF